MSLLTSSFPVVMVPVSIPFEMEVTGMDSIESIVTSSVAVMETSL